MLGLLFLIGLIMVVIGTLFDIVALIVGGFTVAGVVGFLRWMMQMMQLWNRRAPRLPRLQVCASCNNRWMASEEDTTHDDAGVPWCGCPNCGKPHVIRT